MAPPRHRTGLITVRVWSENHLPGALRARITAVDDIEFPQPAESVASSIEAICDAVRVFLESFAGTEGEAGTHA